MLSTVQLSGASLASEEVSLTHLKKIGTYRQTYKQRDGQTAVFVEMLIQLKIKTNKDFRLTVQQIENSGICVCVRVAEIKWYAKWYIRPGAKAWTLNPTESGSILICEAKAKAHGCYGMK